MRGHQPGEASGRARAGTARRGSIGAAAAPHQLTTNQWRVVLRRVGRHFVGTRLPLLSAGIAFFAVLSIAPVLVTALSVYGAVTTPQEALRQLSRVARMLPPQLEPVVADQLTSIATASTHVLTTRGLTGLVLALWTATTAMSSLIDALTLAYHESETRPFLRRTSLALLLVLSGAVLLGALVTTARYVSTAVGAAPDAVRAVVPVLVWAGLAE